MRNILIVLFLFQFIFDLYLDYVGYIGDSSPETKTKILKYFMEEDILKGIEYNRARFAIGIFTFCIKNLAILFLAFSKYPGKLEDYCAKISKDNFFFTTVLYVFFIYTVYTLIFLPFSYYFSFVLEHEFGFSNMSVAFWFWTKLKSYLISMPILAIVSSAALYMIKKVRFYWIFAVPLGGVVLGFISSILYPLLILPIFYTTEPIAAGSLRDKIVSLAKSSNVPVNEIYIIKESEYSKHTNAFFVGFGEQKKIYLYDTLISSNTEGEIISVLAHEIGHWKHDHQVKGIAIEFVFSLIQFSVLYFILNILKKKGDISVREFHSPATVPVFLLTLGIISSFFQPLDMYISRSMEAQADYEALLLTNDKESFISAEIKLAKENKSRLDIHPLIEMLRHSHPKTLDRIQMAEDYKVK
jgi:STE24 endopeptidase